MNGRDRLEVPQGTVVFETPGYISHPRTSPDGQRVAFIEHPLFGDNRGYLSLYDGKTARRLTPEYGGIEAVAWSADGREIWYGAGTTETHWPIKAIDPDSQGTRDGRTVWYVPRDLLVLDIDSRGRVLLTASEAGGALAGAAAGDARDRDLSFGRWALPGHISHDGRTMLLSNLSETDPDYGLLIQRLDGSAPIKVGRGRAQKLSPDGKWALSITPSQPHRVLLFPTGPGEPREVDIGDIDPNVAAFVPGDLTVAVVGRRNGLPAAIVANTSSGKSRTLNVDALKGRAFGLRRFLPTHASPDGSSLAVQADDGKVLAFDLKGTGSARELATLADNEVSRAGRRIAIASTLPRGTGRRRGSARSMSRAAAAARFAR